MRSLKRALLVYILAGMVLVVIASGLSVFLVLRTNLRAQLDKTLLDRASTLGSLVIEEDDGVLELEYDQPLVEANIGVLARISADDGSIIAQSPDWPTEHAPVRVTPGGQPVLKSIPLKDEVDARAVVLAKYASRDPSESAEGVPRTSERFVVVEVIGRTEDVRRAESAVLAALTVGGLFAVVGSAFTVWLGIKRGLAPVRDLGHAVAGIDTRQLTLRGSHRQYPDELRPITLALEDLLDRLQAAMKRERRFTDAAAHELRTPIAELKTITDVTDRWPDPERLHRGVKDAREVVQQMEDLLEGLLVAARGSIDDAQQSIETVELMPLARQFAHAASGRFARQDLSWSYDGEGATWTGPRGTIVAIVRNLIENAAEYTPMDGSIEIRAGANGDPTAFEIESGPVTLEPGEVEYIFEPFWRADASRTNRGHRGLGLSIVDSLAQAIGLRRHSTITPEHRLCIRLASGTLS
jgi:signal transduction histidine kinase